MRYDEVIFVQDGVLATLTYKTLIRQAVEEMFERLDVPLVEEVRAVYL